MRPEDLNPDIVKNRDDEASLFNKKGSVFKAVAKAASVHSTPVDLAELSSHPNSTVRTIIAQNPNTPFFVLFHFLGDDDDLVKSSSRYTLVHLQKTGQLDLSDKGIMEYVIRHEKDNLKAIEQFEDIKNEVKKYRDNA